LQKETLKELKDEGRIAFKYVSPEGNIDEKLEF